MEANLHIHSRYSDGSLWPKEIALHAAESGLDLIALTDHDSVGGVSELIAAAHSVGIQAIAGCEIDCIDQKIGYRSEILAYFPVKPDNCPIYPATKAFLKQVALKRIERLHVFINRARSLFRRDDLSFEDLLVRKLGDNPPPELDKDSLSFGKVDLYQYLKDRALIGRNVCYREFKKAYFDSGLIKDGQFHRAAFSEISAAVHHDGGFLVLPHIGHEFNDDPKRMNAEKSSLITLLQYFREFGVLGIELYWYRGPATIEINELVRRIAEPLGYFFTYGSDCHGPGTNKHTLGNFSGDFHGFPGFPLPFLS